MVDYIKNNAPYVGIYITEDASSEIVANNTPGNTDLAIMTEGNGYIYIQSVVRFEHVISTVGVGENSVGHQISDIDAGTHSHYTGECESGNLILVGEVSNATAAKIKKFVKLNNRTGDAQKYLLHMYATTTFEQFPDESGVLKQYIPVWTTGVSIVEVDGQKDRKMVSIGMWEFWT